MRNMSFSMTTEQIRGKSKTVTRRLGWKFLKVGDFVRPVVKGMGLKKGEKVETIRGPLLILDVRRESLDMVAAEALATAKEGFPHMGAFEFIAMFCKHMKVKPETMITRIEFEYTDWEVVK